MKNKKFIIFLALLLVFTLPAYTLARGENNKKEEKLSFSDVEKHEKYITTTKSFKIDGEILDEIPYKEGEFEGKLSRQEFVDIDYDKNIKTYKFGGWIQDKEYKEVAAALEAQSKEIQHEDASKDAEELPMDIVKLSDGRYQKYIEVEKTFALDVELPERIDYDDGNMKGELSRGKLIDRDERYETKTYIYSGWMDLKEGIDPTESNK